MTVEQVLAVAVPLDEAGRRLVEDIRSAAARAAGAEPGDRIDVVRFEALSSQIEGWAFRQIGTGALTMAINPSAGGIDSALILKGEPLPDAVPAGQRASVERVLAEDGALVVLSLPLEAGFQLPTIEAIAAPPAAERWEAPQGTYGSAAVRRRFEDQLTRAVEGASSEPINPSGIQNKVLTEALRTFVNRVDGGSRVDAPVEYRDGSRAANPFPLRSLALADQPGPSDQGFSFALLSIRHTELDAIVDGAWLRNTQISQTRTQAETDDLVYSISRKQLSALTDHGRTAVELRIYQTGLEPAIVGFYRAVVDHLVQHPRSLTVLPMYFQQPRPARRQPKDDSRRRRGKSKRPGRRPNRSDDAAEQDEATYAPGQTWASLEGGAR